MFVQETLPMFRITERFRPSRARHGKRPDDICEFQAIFNFGTANKLVNKPGIEAVSRTHGVHHVRNRRESRELILTFAQNGPLRTPLDYHQRYLL